MSATQSNRSIPCADGPRFGICLELGVGEHALVEARDRLGAWMQQLGVRDAEFWEILTAAGEACANVYEHSGAAVAGGCPGWIEAWLHDRRLHLVIGDHGVWREPDLARTDAAGRGRGRLLMSKLMDTMLISTGPDGTVVELSKQLVSPVRSPIVEPVRPTARRHPARRAARARVT